MTCSAQELLVRPAPKVSVCVITYNQKDYIGACLEGLVAQETDFVFEVIVGDDASTDGTTEVVQDYAKRYPHLIRTVIHKENVGGCENYRAVHRLARGQYVAHVDGDDICYPNKLRMQSAFFERHSGLSAVFHQLTMIDVNGNDSGRKWPARAPEVFGCSYLITNHPIVGHSSMIYRRGALDAFLQSSDEFIDFRVYVELAFQGQIGYCADCLGGYRVGLGVSRENKFLNHALSVIDYAQSRGIAPSVAATARAKQIYRSALNAFFAKNERLFIELISRSFSEKKLSVGQFVFYLFRHLPGALWMIHRIYVRLRSKGLVVDKKMSFK